MVLHYAKLFVLSLLLIAAVPAAQAQKNLQPGYIVRLDGDTLRGEVDVRGAKRMERICLFRPNSKAAIGEYAPADLKAYGLTVGARYESLPVPMVVVQNTGPAGTASASVKSVLPPVLFLRVLAQGKAMLYFATDEDDRTHYLFRKNGGELAELVQTKRTVYGAGGPVEEQTFPFRQVLSQAFADCPAVQPMLVKAELGDTRLAAIFNRYNTCATPWITTDKSLTRITKLHLGFLAGVQSGSTKMNDDGEIDVSSSLRPVFGVGLLINPGSFNEKLGLRVELLYQSQRYETSYQRSSSVSTFYASSRTATIALNTIRVPVLLRYTLPAGRVRPYLQAGAEVGVLLDREQAQIVESNKFATSTATTTIRPIELRSLGIGATGAIGLLIPVGVGAVQLEARYNNQLDSSSEIAYKLNGPQTVSFLLGYNLSH